ncbi:MAG: hypothetical protein RLZZ15_3630 [Verrucomicrobiota bacterium]|jgi:hypothetical protein
MRFPRYSLPLLGFVVAVSACRKAEVASYRTPKETPPAAGAAASAEDPHAGHAHATAAAPAAAPAGAPAAAPFAPMAAAAPGGAMANTAVPTAGGAGLAWAGPSHWQAKPAGGMRKGTFIIPGEGGATAELSITAFPGDVGGDLANVNRWRGQVQLGPIGEADLGAAIQRLERNGLKIGVVDLGGAPGAGAQRILGAIVPFDGGTWFFKLLGPDALVAKEKAAFVAFLDSVKPAGK